MIEIYSNKYVDIEILQYRYNSDMNFRATYNSNYLEKLSRLNPEVYEVYKAKLDQDKHFLINEINKFFSNQLMQNS